MLPLQFLLIHQHHVGTATAFQPHPQLGYHGHGRAWSTIHQHKFQKQQLKLRQASSPHRHRGNVFLSATENSDTPLSEILEKFAMPLEFKSVGASSSGSSSSSNDATSGKDGSDGDAGTSTSKVETETPSSSSSKAENPTPKTEAKTEASPAPVKTINTIGSFTPSGDTPLANRYYEKKMQLAEEAKQTVSAIEEKTTTETTELSTPAPPTPPRRKFDFGLASERAEPVGGEPTATNDANEELSTPTPPMKLKGFTDFSTPSKQFKVRVDNDNNAGRNNNAETKPLVNKPVPPPSDTSDAAAFLREELNSAPAPVATPKNNVVKEEKAPAATTKSVVKEEKTPAAITTAKEEKAPVATTTTKEEKAPAATSKNIKEEKSTTSSATATTSPSQPSSELIQTQPVSPTNTLTLPSLNLDVEDFGLLPLAIIGISVLSALAVFFKQANENEKGDQNENEESGGLVKKITEESKILVQKVKDAGPAGAVSYALWEAAFWGVSIPVCVVSYQRLTGHWPDLANSDDVKQLGLEAFAFVNFARIAVPFRLGLALSTAPWVDENIMRRFKGGNKEEDGISVEEDLASEQVIPYIFPSYEDEEIGTEAYSGDSALQPEGEEGQAYTNNEEQYQQSQFDQTYDYSEEGKQMAMSQAYQDEQSYYADGYSGDASWQAEEGEQFYPAYENTEEGEYEDASAMAEVMERLNRMEAEAARVASTAVETINAGIDPTLLEYCEPGEVNEECSESIQGYLDSLASTGAVATDGEVKAIVGYLGSLSSNSVTPNENTGAAFTSYLDALSTGYIPAPASANAVANYLDVLSSDDNATIGSATSSPSEPPVQKIGSRINEVEERLSRLETSVTSLPDDIASRLVDWQMSQDKKLSDELEKIMKLLVDGKSVEK